MEQSIKSKLTTRIVVSLVAILVVFFTTIIMSGIEINQTIAMMSVIFFLVTAAAMWFIYDAVANQKSPLDEIMWDLERLVVDELDHNIVLQGRIGGLLKELQNKFHPVTVQQTVDPQAAADNTHNKALAQILESSPNGVMFADLQSNITFINQAAKQLMADNQQAISQSVPGFNANHILGKKIDAFHSNPSHQQNLLSHLTKNYTTKLKFADVIFDLSFAPAMDENGERIGTVVTWAKDNSTAQETQTKQLKDQLSTTTQALQNYQGIVEGVSKSQAIIEFELDGTIITANDNFCQTMGYKLDEIQGKHHSIFVEATYKRSDEYVTFWKGLNSGKFVADEFLRLNKNGDDIWIQASYNPIFDEQGKPYKVVKFATDISTQKRQAVENARTANIANALLQCNTNVLLADNDLTIVYLNNTIKTMLKRNEATIQTQLPQFSVDKLLGSSADIFHKAPATQRNIVKQVTTAHRSQIEVAGLTFALMLTPWLDKDNNRLGTVVEWEDITAKLANEKKERALAATNARIKIALDKCQANVMMADTDLNIIYMNDSVRAMMKGNEKQLQTVLPNFKVDKLIGTCVDDFHKNPAHQRSMLENLRDVYNTNLPVAGITFNLVATPVFDEDGTRLGSIVEWNDITEKLAREQREQAVANENARIKQALDNVSTNTMIADANNTIIYMNQAVLNMMLNAEKDIQVVLPNFNAKNLMGQSIDNFHQNPAHQTGMLQRLKTSYSTEIKVGTRTFGLIANPINDQDNQRIGTVVEWNDRTAEVFIEKEIATLIQAAGEGNLASRISEEGKSGFFLNLTGGLNQLVGIAEGVINETAEMLDAMAHGNLTRRITSDYQGAFNKLKTDANSTSEKLTEVITRINNASSAVASGAEEIAQGNTDLSQRTEEQASSLEETASSMEEMTATVRQNADNAKVANDLAVDATSKAQKGGEVVKRAVNSMAEINESSKKIADIIGVIDEIAFQTNLLALNAAVEAARAGEQGRGFAVVAGEVRNLAQRSAAAAKEIKDLIRDSVSKVQDGSQLVNESGATLSEIVDAISKVTRMIGEISIASNEQSEGIEQVNKAVTQMDEMTQQNAALVEEASAAGEAMADQARGMRQILGFFTIDETIDTRSSASGQRISAPVAKSKVAAKSPVKAAPTSLAAMNFADDDEEWEEF